MFHFKTLLKIIALFLALSQPVHAFVGQAKPWLGVAIEDDKDKKGVLIKDVIVGTPAEDAGLKSGDVIMKVAGHKVSTPSELIALIGIQGVGNVVTVTFLRSGKVLTKDIKLMARPDEVALLRKHVEGQPLPNVQL